MDNSKNLKTSPSSEAYEKSGVSISFNDIQKTLKSLAFKMDANPKKNQVLSKVNGFCGLFEIANKEFYKNPVLVSSTDGVGTKIKIAIEAKKHFNIGIDLVAMSINDILTSGADPLFFLDYISSSYYNLNQLNELLSGIVYGCNLSNMVLIGGETAQMPGFYSASDYDLSGTCIGIIEKSEIIDGSEIEKGDLLFGLASNGFHSNGFSLIRKVLFEDNNYKLTDWISELSSPLEDLLLKETYIYYSIISKILKVENLKIKGIAHITGGGIYENVARILPQNRKMDFLKNYKFPKLFSWFQNLAKLKDIEMQSIFNCGIGMVLCIHKNQEEEFLKFFKQNQFINPIALGKIL